ncbi:MAG: FAD-binding protein, partial [candidate division Zixibacteria bacterium]|nr:FAD-binding protein [candidate division Zixibacteria bacterium]
MSTLFLNRLRSVLSPDKVYSDSGNLAVYSSDASIYSVKPIAVVRVESGADIVKTINICREFDVPVTARAGATGLAGGAVGAGVILDFCAYDKKIRIDSQKRLARVASGVICDDLNRAASKYGLMFPPDPSSGDSCRIGGMLGNNSSGARTVRYGTTRKYTKALNIVTASGKQIFIEPLKAGSDKLKIFFRYNPEFEQVFNLIISKRDIILPRRRNVKKNSTGYDLWTFIDRYDKGYVDFTKLLVGSECTLCLFESADVILEELPPELFTCLLFFKRYHDIGKAIPPLLRLKPYSLEVADSNSMDLMGREKYSLPEDAAVMLLMQFSKKDSAEIDSQLSKIIKAGDLCTPPVLETDNQKQKALWAARKALLPILYLHHPKKKPLSFVEDACLPTEKLPEIFEFVERTFKKHELMYGSFGHIGDGNIHIKPLVDASDATDREKMRLVSMEIYNEILRLGGVVSGEHADGRVRSPFLRQVYGDEVYEIFRQIKKILDPHGILNPGVKLTDNRDITENIDSKRLNWNCSQCGKCVPYCPSFHARRSEIYSPRGRIKIRNYPGTAGEDQRESLETCINCKNCRIVCPANCDASTDSRYYKEEHRRFALEPMFIAMNNPGL